MTINGAKFDSTILRSELIIILYIASGAFHNPFKNEVINTLLISKSSIEDIINFFLSSKSFNFHIFCNSSFILEFASSLSLITIII